MLSNPLFLSLSVLLGLMLLAAAAVLIYKYFTFPRFSRTGKDPADLAIYNARVFTSDRNRPEAESLAVKGKKIVYVGRHEGLNDFVGPNTRLINGSGRRVTPGFIDNHCHPLWIGGLMALMTKELFECKNFEELKKAVLKHAKENPDLPFVSGVGWRMEYVPGGEPKKEMMDEVVNDRPLFLMAYSGQGGWLNSKAVELMESRNPAAFEALVPVRDKTGKATGYLRHYHAINFFDYYTAEELGEPVQQKILSAMEKVLNEALSVGVTAVDDVQIYKEFVPLLLKFRDRGGFDKIKVRGSFYVGHEDLKDEAQLVRDLNWWKETGKKESTDHFSLGDSLKFYIDGTWDTRTAFMLEPYCDVPGSTGEPVWTQEDFNRVIEICDGLGLQCCTHACGDAGAKRTINAYERAITKNGKRGARHRVEHCELPVPDDRKRMALLGIHAAMHPTHFFCGPEVEKAFGQKRLQGFMPWRSLEKAGVHVSFGSDWCAGPFNPLYGMLIASTRFNYKMNDDWGPKEKISIENALRHWTIDSAADLFIENKTGSLEPGKDADLVIFNTDPLSINSWWFLLTHKVDLGNMDDFVDATLVDGQIVYQKTGAILAS